MYAVLIPYVTTESGDALLMEIRSMYVTQPGEVCFPGGRMEEGEKPEETAVREACEELGISESDIEVLDVLEPEVMGDMRIVYPVVAGIRRSDDFGDRIPDNQEAGKAYDISALKISECEVAEVFLLPVQWLMENEPQHYDLAQTSDDELPEKLAGFLSRYGEYRKHGSTDYWEYEGRGIWGLTARLLKHITESGRK